ncbi:hypothetical protein D3C72_1928310 [compost metagenome]
MIPSAGVQNCVEDFVCVFVPIHTDVVIYTDPTEVRIVELGSQSLSAVGRFSKNVIKF